MIPANWSELGIGEFAECVKPKWLHIYIYIATWVIPGGGLFIREGPFISDGDLIPESTNPHHNNPYTFCFTCNAIARKVGLWKRPWQRSVIALSLQRSLRSLIGASQQVFQPPPCGDFHRTRC